VTPEQKNRRKSSHPVKHVNQNNQGDQTRTIKMAEFVISDFHKAIPEYNGSINDLNIFLACCDYYNNSLSEEGKAIFMRSLVRKFTDRAFDFYEKKSWNDWNELKTSTKKYFSSPQSLEGYQMELGKMKQTMKQFANSVKKSRKY